MKKLIVIALLVLIPSIFVYSSVGWNGEQFEYMIISGGVDYFYSTKYETFASQSGAIQVDLPIMVAEVEELVNGDKDLYTLSGFYNIAGSHGWELITTEGGVFVFKRRKK